MRLAHAVLVVTAVLAAGCGAEPEAAEEPARPLPASAKAALECDGEPYRTGRGDYQDGLATVQDFPETALVDYFSEALFSDELPADGYRVEPREDGRALLSYDVDGRTKVAVITTDGMRDFNGSTGWGVETWAQCDLAEMPADFTEAAGTGVWEDAQGDRVPTARVRSFQGAEHCDWEDVTYLVLGPGDARWYLRDPGGEFDGLLRGAFDPSATLPQDATDTGWRRDGRQLWVTEDAAYLVSLADRQDVERWPAPQDRSNPPLCS